MDDQSKAKMQVQETTVVSSNPDPSSDKPG